MVLMRFTCEKALPTLPLDAGNENNILAKREGISPLMNLDN